MLTNAPLPSLLVDLRSLKQFLMVNVGYTVTEESDSLIKLLHPFILRRLKIDVEDQLPITHEHLLCNLSKRQREFYDHLITHDVHMKKIFFYNHLN